MRLTGLKAHHPLGFLAACGLLRLTRDARLGWSHDENSDIRMAYISINDIEADKLKGHLVQRVADSAASFVECLEEYSISEAESAVDDFRKAGMKALDASHAARGASPAIELIASIGSDIKTSKKKTGKDKGKNVIDTSNFAMTSGQQDLIVGIRGAAEQMGKKSEKGDVLPKVREAIEEALFGPWLYRDDEHSLGWDPESQRLHALRNKAPTNDSKNRSVRGALFLASQALPLFPCFVVGGKRRTTGFEQNGDWFSWPIWRQSISLDTLRSLLCHPMNGDLRCRGVEVVYRCRCTRSPGSAEGNYRLFGNAEECSWADN